MPTNMPMGRYGKFKQQLLEFVKKEKSLVLEFRTHPTSP
jgi:hypothetical protein